MMKTIAALTVIGAAAAFAPAQQGRVNTAVSLDISNQLGAQMPVSYFLPPTAVDDSFDFDFSTIHTDREETVCRYYIFSNVSDFQSHS